MSLYNKVNQPCSSRLPEIKKEEISEEKIGHKRCSKEKLSRGSVSSDETDGKIESENIATIVAKKEKSAQGGKGFWIDTLLGDACRLNYDKLFCNNCYNINKVFKKIKK
ncbi:hypothetical protein RhiirC2_708685 [Rhizophagus irregularis]|uniref:Uncharacterized protein n=1 Tax=Rhizophagus irregularis TaxID=588596 RepID=A0A2N1NL99_9GLOM|nr:hypothetical protein RhiirC2_708685 [Rhizophagus irregularis]